VSSLPRRRWSKLCSFSPLRQYCPSPLRDTLISDQITPICGHEPQECDHAAVCAGLGLGMGGLQVVSGLALGAGPMYFLGVAGSTGHVLWQSFSTNLDAPSDCLASFKSNAGMGAVLMAGIVGDRLLAEAEGSF
jgi:hypothetical protein